MERERLFLLLVVHVKRVVVFAELVVDQCMGGEHLWRQPRAMQPVAVVDPLEEAGLNDDDQKNRGYEEEK